jgi:FAD/FMN-containing dehydrogenase
MLDKYVGWRVKDEERKLVEADAGIHLGADPSDPTGRATLEASLPYGLWKERGWALSDTGGITHQTVSGFTATGSSGGSLHFSVNDNLWGFRAIDGTGEVYEVSRDDADPDLFYSMSPNFGLLGVVSRSPSAAWTRSTSRARRR